MAPALLDEAVIAGARLAFDTYGIKEADALTRAVQRGVVSPSIENARRLQAQMASDPMSKSRIQKTLARMQQPPTPKGTRRLQELRAELRTNPNMSNAQDWRREGIQALSVAPRLRELGITPTNESPYFQPAMGLPIRTVTPEMARAVAISPEDWPARLKHIHAQPGGHINMPRFGPGATRPALEHEVGERWLHDQAVRNKKPLTPFGTHYGVEPLVREWGIAAQHDGTWDDARELRRDNTSTHLEKSFGAVYKGVGGTQGAPVPADSRQSRAMARVYDRLYGNMRKKDRFQFEPDLENVRMTALTGLPLTAGAEQALSRPATQQMLYEGPLKQHKALMRRDPAVLRQEALEKLGAYDALAKYAAFTPAFLRSIARDSDVAIDEPEFKEKCRGLTGKAHLDDMSSSELGQVAKMLWSEKKAEDDKKPEKEKGTHPVVKGLKAVGGLVGATAAQMAAGHVAMSGEGTRGKHDYGKDHNSRSLAKRMGEKNVPLAPKDARHVGPGMGFLRTRSKKKGGTGKGIQPGLFLPKGTSEAIAAHEVGHLKNWRAIRDLLGEKGMTQLAMGSYLGFAGAQLTGLPATMYAAGSDDPSWVPAVAHTALATPRLLDEAAASLHAVKHLVGEHGLLKGLQSSARLLPAYGTYAAVGAAPLAITALRKYLKHRRDREDDEGSEYEVAARDVHEALPPSSTE